MNITRRQALLGLGIAGAFPFLRTAAAQAAPTASQAPRLALFVSGGWLPAFSYVGANSNEAAFNLGTALEPLAPWKDRVRVFRGLLDKPGQEKANPTNAHENIGRYLLNSDGPDSIDNALGTTLSAGAPHRALAWAAYREKNYYRRFQGATEGGETDPRRTYRDLFAPLIDNPSGPTPEQLRRETRLRTIEATEKLGQQLADRLPEAHKNQIMTYVSGLGSFRASSNAILECGAPPIQNVPPIATYNEPRSNPQVYPKVVRAQVDAAAATLMCGFTNVTSMFFSMDDNFPDTAYEFIPEIGNGNPKMADHGLSHDASPNNEAGRRKTLANRWFVSEIAHFCKQLEMVPSGTNSAGKAMTLLDRTMVVWVQAFGHGAHSRNDHMALVMNDPMNAFKANKRYVSFGDQKTMGDLWATVRAALTGNRAAFGLPQHSSGAIADVLV
jgi:hypothetical protein